MYLSSDHQYIYIYIEKQQPQEFQGFLHHSHEATDLIERSTVGWVGGDVDDDGTELNKPSSSETSAYLDLHIRGIEIPFSLARIFLLITSIVVIITVVFAPYSDWNANLGETWSRTQNAFFISVGHTAYIISISTLIVLCLLGQGGLLNALLSLSPFLPLSRLSYSAYLLSVPIVLTVYASSSALHYYSDVMLLYYFITNLFLAFIFGFFLYAFAERPARAMIRYYLEQKTQIQ